jgi:uncharacterized protein YndB with AHSA1/START domain
MTTHFNSKLDLTFERIVDVPPHLIWRAGRTRHGL